MLEEISRDREKSAASIADFVHFTALSYLPATVIDSYGVVVIRQ